MANKTLFKSYAGAKLPQIDALKDDVSSQHVTLTLTHLVKQ